MIVEKKSFDTVVKVEFPMQGVYSLGFLTNPDTDSIFIMTTPNPSNGFLITTKNYEILDITPEECIKSVISMGTIAAKTVINRERD